MKLIFNLLLSLVNQLKKSIEESSVKQEQQPIVSVLKKDGKCLI